MCTSTLDPGSQHAEQISFLQVDNSIGQLTNLVQTWHLRSWMAPGSGVVISGNESAVGKSVGGAIFRTCAADL